MNLFDRMVDILLGRKESRINIGKQGRSNPPNMDTQTYVGSLTKINGALSERYSLPLGSDVDSASNYSTYDLRLAAVNDTVKNPESVQYNSSHLRAKVYEAKEDAKIHANRAYMLTDLIKTTEDYNITKCLKNTII